MDFQRIWVLRGPNVWARFPVVEAELDLGEWKDFRPGQQTGFLDRILASLPGLDEMVGVRGAANLAHTLQHLTLEFQRRAGSDSGFGLVRETSRAGLYRVIVGYEEETLVRACLEAARALCLAALTAVPFDAADRLRALRELAQEVRLGPSTAALVQAARARGIPTRRLNTGSMVQLGQGKCQRRIWAAETDRTSSIAEAIAQDKQLTRSLLQAAGVPVPEGRPVSDADEAWQAAGELGLPVVVKPQDGNHGRGVGTNLTTREQVIRAYAAARDESSSVLVERFVPGDDYRLLVVGDRLVAAARREPAQVVGDGRSSITELVHMTNQDPRRSDGHATVLSWIKLDAVGLAVLEEQGYTPEAVPPAGARVLIRRNGNLSTGGTATDVTDQVHPEVAARAVDAAAVVGLDIAGVDVVAVDITRPLEEQGGAVVEVNAGPGLRMHLEPSAGTPRPVAEAIVALLYPEGQTSRIPVVAITGVNGKTTTTRLMAHLLKSAGRFVGMTCTDGLYLDGRRVDRRDCSGPRSARAVFLNPRVEAAVLETARGGILREGLGFDHCDVAVVTNIGGGDHFGLRGIETVEELARVKRVVVEAVAPGGSAVLNAADPLVAAMAEHCPGSVVWFAPDGAVAREAARSSGGGRAVFVRAGSVVLAEARREEVLAPLAGIPLTQSGALFQVENVLAACAAAWVLGLPPHVVRAGLESFSGDVRQCPGRFNVFQARGATVIADYAHNPSALAALTAALDQFPQRRRSLVFTGCNRRDVDVVEMGTIAGNGFDRVILYEDRGHNDREEGELNALLRRGLTGGRRVAETIEAGGEQAAIELALQSLAPGELLVIGIESIEEALALIQSRLGNGEGVPTALPAGSP